MASIVYSTTIGGVEQADSLEIDVLLSVTPSMAAEATQFPVENGSAISDHVIERPDSLRLEGLITDSPLTGAGFGGYVGAARAVLEGVLRSRRPVTIETYERIYTGMVMVELQLPQDPNTGDALRFLAGFQKISTVSTQTVAIPRAPKPGKATGGKKPTQPASDPVAKKVSVLRQLADWTRGKGDSPGAPKAEE